MPVEIEGVLWGRRRSKYAGRVVTGRRVVEEMNGGRVGVSWVWDLLM